MKYEKMEMRCWVGKEGKPSEGKMRTRVIMWKFNKYMNALFPKAKKKIMAGGHMSEPEICKE